MSTRGSGKWNLGSSWLCNAERHLGKGARKVHITFHPRHREIAPTGSPHQSLPVYYPAAAAAAAAKSFQLCPTLCDPIDGSPSGSTVPGILQARTLEWIAISFSNAWKWKVKVKSLSPVWLLATPQTAAYQAPPSMGFSRQEYWNGVPLPSLVYYPRTQLMVTPILGAQSPQHTN